MSEENVNLKDVTLNKNLPSYTITRAWQWDKEKGQFFGSNGGSGEISRSYWENAITVSEYLKRLNRVGVFEKTLYDQNSFDKLLVKLHTQQSMGLRRDNLYGGQSIQNENFEFSDDWQKQYRKPDKKISARASTELCEELEKMCATTDAKFWQDSTRHIENAATLTENFGEEEFTCPVDIYVPPSLLEHNPAGTQAISDSLEELLKSNTETSKVRNSIHAVFVNQAFITGKLDKSNPNYLNEDVMFVMYPSAEFIPEYLELVRKNLRNSFESTDRNEQLRSLARAYQAGIRSQAFETVWNSEMMGIVNFFLSDVLEMKPIPHGNFDFRAFLLSPEAFESHFLALVNHFNEESSN